MHKAKRALHVGLLLLHDPLQQWEKQRRNERSRFVLDLAREPEACSPNVRNIHEQGLRIDDLRCWRPRPRERHGAAGA
eukprot:4628487-Lingulodinium_polyedra.AAC.1